MRQVNNQQEMALLQLAMLAMTKARAGRYDEVINILTESLRIVPDHVETYHQRYGL